MEDTFIKVESDICCMRNQPTRDVSQLLETVFYSVISRTNLQQLINLIKTLEDGFDASVDR